MYFRLFEKIKTLKLNSDGRMGSKLAFTESSKSSSRAHFTQSCSRLLYHSGASMPLWSPLDLRTTHNPTTPIWTSELSDSNRAKAGSDLLIRTIFPSILPHSRPVLGVQHKDAVQDGMDPDNLHLPPKPRWSCLRDGFQFAPFDKCSTMKRFPLSLHQLLLFFHKLH